MAKRGIAGSYGSFIYSHSEGVEDAKNKVHLEGDRKEPYVYLGVCFHLLVHGQSPLVPSQIRTLRAKHSIVFLPKTL